MFALRQRAVQYAGRPGGYRALCRYSTTQHGKTGDEVHHHAGSTTEHGHHHTGPKNEPLGIQLYIVLAVIPASYAVYLLSQTSEDGSAPGISKIIDSYSYYKEKWKARNTLHTTMVEQAAFDRNLFYNSKGTMHVDLKFPEVFNMGSPRNIPAGHGSANLDQLVAHYQKINSDAEKKKLAALATRESEKK